MRELNDSSYRLGLSAALHLTAADEMRLIRTALSCPLSAMAEVVERMTDVELLENHRAGGDERAFAELVRRHLGWVYGVARRSLSGRDAHLAEDVAQAV